MSADPAHPTLSLSPKNGAAAFIVLSIAIQTAVLLPAWLGSLGTSLILLGAGVILPFFLVSIENAVVLLPLFLFMPVTLGSGSPIQLSELAVAMLMIMLLFNAVLENGSPLRWRFPLSGIFFFLLLSEALSLVGAPYLMAGIKHMARMVEGLVIFYLMVNTIRSKDTMQRALYAIVSAGLLASLYGLIQFANALGQPSVMDRRVFGLLGGGYGAFVGSSIVALVCLWTYRKSLLNRILFVAGLPILGLALMVHQTRTWYGSVFLAVLWVSIKSGWKKGIRLIAFSLILFVSAAALLFQARLFHIVPESVSSGVQQTTFQLGLSAGESKFISGISRLFIWSKGFRIFLDHPVFGFGVSNLRFQNMVTGQLGDPSNPDNGYIDSQYLNVLYETGLFGFLIWMLLFLAVWRNTRRLQASDRNNSAKTVILSVSGSFIVFFAGGLFWCITEAHETIAYLAYLLGLLFSAQTVLEAEEKSHDFRH
ncbi:MAG TPA: O-antigen ligase family protein [bacterium]